jgi:hypothetical protein
MYKIIKEPSSSDSTSLFKFIINAKVRGQLKIYDNLKIFIESY